MASHPAEQHGWWTQLCANLVALKAVGRVEVEHLHFAVKLAPVHLTPLLLEESSST